MILESKPVFSPRPWGDWTLNELYGVEFAEPIGEVWLLSDFSAMRTELVGGGFSGFPGEFTAAFAGVELPRFPLLVKYISTSEWLSVQVHPDDELAALEGEPWGKNECWYFLEDGVIGAGLKDPSKRSGEIRGEDLFLIEPKRGDLVCLPAGTVHSLGPGTRVIEVQQTSDTTYRLYDWDRRRELHLEKSAAALKPYNRARLLKNASSFAWEYFQLELAREVNGTGLAVTLESKPRLYMVLEDTKTFESPVLLVRPGEYWSGKF